MPYAGPQGEHLVKTCVKKLQRCLKEKVRFRILYDQKKMSYFCSVKDKVPDMQRSHVIYRLRCPGCGEKYIGKTERCLQTRLHEHGVRNDQPMFRHLTNCEPFNQLVQLHPLADIDKMNCYVYLDAHIFTAVLENYEILDFNSNWSQLCFLEAYYIKLNKPKINDGLKASKELELFK